MRNKKKIIKIVIKADVNNFLWAVSITDSEKTLLGIAWKFTFDGFFDVIAWFGLVFQEHLTQLLVWAGYKNLIENWLISSPLTFTS